MMSQDKNKQQSLSGNKEDDAENGLHHNNSQPNASNSILSGIKQRLLSFIFREIWNEESDNAQVCFVLELVYAFSELCLDFE